MSSTTTDTYWPGRMIRSGSLIIAMAALTLASFGTQAQLVSQSPLQVGSSVAGNLAIVGSLEFPTMVSVGNLGNYNANTTYVGYFDSSKCYGYSYSETESERHFYPVNNSGPNCSGSNWSGNYLNWATTQSIDAFRKALTGGYRVKDTTTETWLEKARQDGQGQSTNFPNRRLPNSGTDSTLVSNATPFNWSSFSTRILGLDNQMYFTRTGTLGTATNPSSGISPVPVIPYNPGGGALDQDKIYAVSVRVKVCDSSVGVESNCVQYGSNWKPEGLIQQNAEKIRFSAFGYLGDGRRYNTGDDALQTRDGGVMRARAKFVGPMLGASNVTNPNREWSGTTGIFIDNPDPDDATATETATGQTVVHSGVINFLNKTGQIVPDALYKRYDPVSELYYTAVRYFKNLGNVPAYSTISGTETKKRQLVDGLPVITDWDDPIQHWCQKNAILGIGDTNTSNDKNLPGSNLTSTEPSKPSEVSNDTTVNVVTATNKVAALEGITINNNSFDGSSGRSAFIAGLAYDSNTKDIRSDLENKQTISTYWVDIQEFSTLKSKNNNQYWLAAKYGGFQVPNDFDPYARTTALPLSWWNKSGETLTPTNDPRPDNFYTAAQADQMIASLTRAFKDISQDQIGSGASLAANSTKLEAGTITFQAQFFSNSWRGELNAFDVNANTGALISTPIWQAGSQVPAWSSRNIYFHNPQGSNYNEKYRLFNWSNLGSTQQTALDTEANVNYIRGNRAAEEPNGAFRARTGVLGDIVHSQPVYVGTPNAALFMGATFTGANAYPAFVSNQANRTPTIYVGANDGMLHGFRVSDGVETYAFIPNRAILNGLKDVASPLYEHKFFVDGEMTVADVYFSGGGGSWKTVLIGTMGRGGPGIFALDVTNPADIKFLWERDATSIPALGKNIGKPIIAQIANGQWRVILGNGPDSAAGKAQLIMIDIESGAATAVDTAVAGNNGLSAVYTWDADADGFIDTAYAGDLKGNLWKFSSLAASPSATTLFTATDNASPAAAQPITAAPLVGINPETAARWIFFGTGQFLNTVDQASNQVQTWYGFIDTNTLVAKSDLVSRSILAEGTINDFGARVIQTGSASDFVGKKGWYIDLVSPVNGAEGERMVVPNQFQGNVLIGTTRIPDAGDICRPTGRGFVMAIDPFTGARLTKTFFDITLDGLFNNADMLSVNGVPTIISGIGFSSSPNQPMFIENVMQVGLDDGTTEAIRTQGTGADARRTSWREILGN